MRVLILPTTLFFFLLISCNQKQQTNNYQEYGYKHLVGVTGINTLLITDDSSVAVKFSANSDSIALAALRNLTWNILYPNANGKDIILYGVLSNKIKTTRSEKGKPHSEKYQDFRLIHWKLTTPFKYRQPKETIETVPIEFKDIEIETLAEVGFTTLTFRNEVVSYDRFQKVLN